MKIELNRAGIRAALLFAAKQDIRYYLNGVMVEATPTTTRAVGTNGHVMAIHHHEGTENDVAEKVRVIVPRDVLAMLKKPTKRNAALPLMLEGEGVEWSIHDFASGVRIGFHAIEGVFPDYARVVPSKYTDEPATINPDYLGLMSKVAAAFGRRPTSAVIRMNGSSGALATIEGEPGFCAVLMPMRNDSPPAERPAWLPAAPVQPTKPEVMVSEVTA